MGRPSPRTQGVTEEGETFQKFGTQQLKFVGETPPKLGTPYQGVTQVDTGKGFKGFTTSGYTGTLSTAFSQQIQAGITGHQSIMPRAEAIKMQEEKLAEMGIPKFPDLGLGDLFTPKDTGCECQACKDGTGQCSDKNPKCDAWDLGCEIFGANDKHGCECQACKEGTGQCSDKVPQCDAWDLVCEGTGGATVGVVGGTNYFFWIKIILIVIGIGVLLWLLRPLFGVAKNITGVSKSAVTRVNGMK